MSAKTGLSRTERTLAMRLDQTMRARGMSTRMLAKRIGVDHRQVARWRRGFVTPGATYIVQLAQALGVSTDYLLGH